LGGFGAPGDTVYLCVVDESGMAVSLCQSLYHPWGARVYLPGSGVVTQNRGSSFSLDPRSPNVVGPGRRARSKLSPVVLADGPDLVGLVGTMGRDVQPQTVLQHIVRHRFSGLDVAETLAHPRFYLHRGLAQSIWSDAAPVLGVEERTPPAIEEDLIRRGHHVQRGPAYAEAAGHAQMIIVFEDGWAGAADPRSRAGQVGTG
jgi:gamma-glutamyltranspeptidase/glutathione hydrolase